MANTQSDTLQHAIEALGAVEVAPGRYAIIRKYLGGYETMRWNEAKRSFEHLAVMPAWWTPERRYAWRVDGANGESWRIAEDDYRQFGMPRGATSQRITADLETGEEVPCG
jgi:hypothetical protein